MKEEGLVEWNWHTIFWPVWVGTCLLSLLAIGELILLLGSACAYFSE